MTILIFLAALIGSVALGIPIAYSLLLSGVALMVHLGNFDSPNSGAERPRRRQQFPAAGGAFFHAGGAEIMNAGGLSRRIVGLAIAMVGHVRGGLGYVTIIAACLMASLSGSAVANTAALTALLLPMMVRAGHQKARSGGLIASAGIIAPIIPPSIPFVVFGVTANVSIGKLFMAGIVPGLMMGTACAIAWWITARAEAVVTPPKASRADVVKALRESSWALVLPFIVLVGLKFGVFTPTEAAVVAAVYAFLWRRWCTAS